MLGISIGIERQYPLPTIQMARFPPPRAAAQNPGSPQMIARIQRERAEAIEFPMPL